MPVRFKPALFCFLTLLFSGCYDFMKIMQREKALFLKLHPDASRFAPWKTDSVHYVAAGNPDAQAVVFVHGSPGSWDAYAPLLNDSLLLRRFFLISYDRPGFGKTANGKPEPSLAQQADALAAVLKHAGVDSNIILLGHSWGGPIIVQFAGTYPGRCAGLVNVAGSIDPALEKRRWYNKAAKWKVVKWISPVDLNTSNDELWNAKSELEKQAGFWPQIPKMITVQGLKDNLVPAGNADFADRMLGKERSIVYRMADEGHFVLWYKPDLMRKAIFEASVKSRL
jgi:pimeloyl-ACP methyl ester carboxylesterase